jgi:hypothetical protein
MHSAIAWAGKLSRIQADLALFRAVNPGSANGCGALPVMLTLI